MNLIYSGSYEQAVDENARIDSIPRWFEGVYVNFAENLLYSREALDPTSKRGTKGKEDTKIALTEVREGSTEIRHVSWGQLRSEVGELASAMKARGFRKGDRCAVVASNSVDTLKVFLATAALGGSFSSSSTDMGTKGVLDRLLQIEPKVGCHIFGTRPVLKILQYLFMDDWAVYNGKTIDLRQKMTEIVNGMMAAKGFAGIVSMPRFPNREPSNVSRIPKAQLLKDFLSMATSKTLQFEKTEFRDPFMIAYSSGTTGVPKCIVHSIGGALISAAKEGILHREMDSTGVALQYTTT